MNLAGLTDAYSLTPLTVSPDKLLLDPTNPRLITEASHYLKLSAEQIMEPTLQRQVLDRVCKKEHEVKKLIASISEMGFIGGVHEIIVKDMGNGGPYLVIEGNRRTAALRVLLSDPSKLRPDVRKSIERVEVKLFQYRGSPRHDEQKVIDALLGSIHIDGPREWGALERAHYIHRTYVRLLNGNAFAYDADLAREVGTTFNMSNKAVHTCLIICRVYEQLVRANVGVEPKHYTLIDLATKTRAVADAQFGLDKSKCELSKAGIAFFAQLMIREDAPVQNPKLFRTFVDICIEGTELEILQCAHGERSLKATYEAISRRRARRFFRDELEVALDVISELSFDEFKGTEAERSLIRKISALVSRRLAPLAA